MPASDGRTTRQVTRTSRVGSRNRPDTRRRRGTDNWPHTKRPLPWLLAGFLVMIFLVPFDSIIFKVHMPANATFDRVFLVVMVAVFVGQQGIARSEGRPGAG